KALSVLLSARKESIDRTLKRVKKRELTIPTYFSYPVRVAYFVTAEPNISLLLEEVLVANPDCMIACCVDPDRNTVSLRSKGDFDVASFASIYGGGGHRNASGHAIPRDLFDNMVDEIHMSACTQIERIEK